MAVGLSRMVGEAGQRASTRSPALCVVGIYYLACTAYTWPIARPGLQDSAAVGHGGYDLWSLVAPQMPPDVVCTARLVET